MAPLSAGDVRVITLKAAADAGTPAEVTISVQGSAGVNLAAIGCALGLEPFSVRLNGFFVSRGAGFVSSLQWDSLLSFFVARGLPAGASPFDSIVVQGKLINQAGWSFSSNAEYVGHPGFKRKITVNERPLKKSRLFESCLKEQNIGTVQATEDEFLSIKRRFKFYDDHPSKKGKVGKCCSDFHSSSMKDEGYLCSTELSIDQNFLSLQENHNYDLFRMKRQLKLDDDRPFKKGKIDERNSGFCNEASRAPFVFSRTG